MEADGGLPSYAWLRWERHAQEQAQARADAELARSRPARLKPLTAMTLAWPARRMFLREQYTAIISSASEGHLGQHKVSAPLVMLSLYVS
jgi:hypothetical protein